MVIAVADVTVLLVTMKVAVVAPAATVTDAGTVAAFVLLLASATTAPPAGAAVAKVTVPVLARAAGNCGRIQRNAGQRRCRTHRQCGCLGGAIIGSRDL